MAYEIDFVGSDATEKDYDAICFRYEIGSASYICVYDGGSSGVGDDLAKDISDYYTNGSREGIDLVICSHPDMDHSAGLRTILENFNVKALMMNRPWLYIDELFERVSDGRITKESLEKTLREAYPYVNELEQIATQKKIPILEGFLGIRPLPEMRIMSPSKEFYLDCIAHSDKTPAMEKAAANAKVSVLAKLAMAVKGLIAAVWGKDDIREGVTTSPENETSIIVKVHPTGFHPFLLVGDAGCESLTRAMDYADYIGQPLSDCDFLQVPHHGGRHNVSPSVLDRLIGPKISEHAPSSKQAFVSVAKDSDHPKKCVTNAFITRGCDVYVCRATTICHHRGKVKDRRWSPVTKVPFSPQVEEWDD